ncbi:pimeloyl-ACP methyl ester carboxylesterase [Hamadaea flava]|uniref:Alpha/beta fold hydrolase n=1 Tax=Hamadaea flava TaxID=1742688 RepID=A0ABV8LV63_9ACTN|nr:alpha/beta hydrolase [Hamadaea flava]MCP2328828.1 pimeloyl-ACP methyl ester carboxylesterase [Hamadaea flava]
MSNTRRAQPRLVPSPRGGVLSVEVSGAPDGRPVFLMHGTPGSRSGPRPRSIVLYRMGVRLISYDRPGYGDSTRVPGRLVRDAADDVAAIADDLGLATFAVIGRSGGGPHALACAALLPGRVTRTAALVSIAPPDAPGLAWFDGMAKGNTSDYEVADRDIALFTQRLLERADHVRRDPRILMDALRGELRDSDLRVIDDAAFRRHITDTYVEAMRYGGHGWVDDALAFRRDWGFELSGVDTEVLLWHGADDSFSPVGHTEWLASQLKQVEVQIQADTAHFGAMEILPQALAWVIADA